MIIVIFNKFSWTTGHTHTCSYKPKHILSNDVHELQPGTYKEDDVFDICRGEAPCLEGKHLLHFMFLKGTATL